MSGGYTAQQRAGRKTRLQPAGAQTLPAKTNSGSATPRRISILGATGTVGQNTLDLISRNQDAYNVVALTANQNAAALAKLAIAHKAQFAVVSDPSKFAELKAALAGTSVEAGAGETAMMEAATRPADWTMGAIVGAAGLKPTLAAVCQGKSVALANKECLVSAGHVFMREVGTHNTTLLPVDSEHSAVFQSIGANDQKALTRIILTGSGGPFRTWSKEDIKNAGVEQALKHPNWTMGRKITIDSATLMNKGLELIEAYHLFDVTAEQLEVVIHPQSIIHCLVEFSDRSVLAQMSAPDMRTPIAVSLAWPERMDTPTDQLDFVALSRLDFEAPDRDKFPALKLAEDCLRENNGAAAALNAVNEVAVEAFLNEHIRFGAIPALCGAALDQMTGQGALAMPQSLDEVLALDAAARRVGHDLLSRFAD